MLSHFSPAAQTLVHLAEQECRNASHYYLGTEHLLLAMAISPTPDVAACFRERGTEAWRVKQAVRALMDEPAEHPWEGVVITPRTLRIFASATSAARARGSLVEPVDLLNGIIDDGRGVAARALHGLASQTAPTT